jgi:glycosidase
MHPNHAKGVNAEEQLASPDSVFNFWSSVLAARKEHKDSLVYGNFKLLDQENEGIFAYLRESTGESVLVACNFGAKEVRWAQSQEVVGSGKIQKVLLTTHGRTLEHFQGDEIVLKPFEACALLL